MKSDVQAEAAYDRLLAAVGAAAPRIAHTKLTSHWPLVGAAFDRGVLVVGQAVYGWITDWAPSAAAAESGRSSILTASRDVLAHRPDAMDWIGGHRVENTPFWRTAHEVADALTPGPGAWYSRIAWANLYPVAPNDVKGNPEGPLREVQTFPAAEFLSAAVEMIDPRLVLVLAGPYLWPFVEPLGLDQLAARDRPLMLAGRRRNREWVCGMHPGGAQRRGWPARRYAALIIEEARRLLGPATSPARPGV